MRKGTRAADRGSCICVLVTGQAGVSEGAERKEVEQEGQGAETKLRRIPRPGMGKLLETVQNPWKQTAAQAATGQGLMLCQAVEEGEQARLSQ